jgi:hypothetical protein
LEGDEWQERIPIPRTQNNKSNNAANSSNNNARQPFQKKKGTKYPNASSLLNMSFSSSDDVVEDIDIDSEIGGEGAKGKGRDVAIGSESTTATNRFNPNRPVRKVVAAKRQQQGKSGHEVIVLSSSDEEEVSERESNPESDLLLVGTRSSTRAYAMNNSSNSNNSNNASSAVRSVDPIPKNIRKPIFREEEFEEDELEDENELEMEIGAMDGDGDGDDGNGEDGNGEEGEGEGSGEEGVTIAPRVRRVQIPESAIKYVLVLFVVFICHIFSSLFNALGKANRRRSRAT